MTWTHLSKIPHSIPVPTLFRGYGTPDSSHVPTCTNTIAVPNRKSPLTIKKKKHTHTHTKQKKSKRVRDEKEKERKGWCRSKPMAMHKAHHHGALVFKNIACMNQGYVTAALRTR